MMGYTKKLWRRGLGVRVTDNLCQPVSGPLLILEGGAWGRLTAPAGRPLLTDLLAADGGLARGGSGHRWPPPHPPTYGHFTARRTG